MDGSTVYRQTPEVGAVCINVHARICAGGGERGNAFPTATAKLREGLPGNLREPVFSIGQGIRPKGSRTRKVPGRSHGLRCDGSAQAEHTKTADYDGTGWRINKPKGRNAGSRSALIVLMTAGN